MPLRKKDFFSKIGSPTLIRLVMSAKWFPIYLFSLFKALSGDCKNVEKLMHNLHWEGIKEGEGKGAHLVKCEMIGRLITWELEIGNLRYRNKPLLAKWLWHLSLKPNSLWHRIIASK